MVSDRYARSSLIWGSNASHLNSSILFIGLSSTLIEIIRHICLAGVQYIFILYHDSTHINHPFAQPSIISNNLSKRNTIIKNITALNPDVCIQFICITIDPINLVFDLFNGSSSTLSFIKQFDMDPHLLDLILIHESETDKVVKLTKLMQQKQINNISIVYFTIKHQLLSLYIQYHSMLPSIYNDNQGPFQYEWIFYPFANLLAFFQQYNPLDVDSIDHMNRIPWPCIIYQAYNQLISSKQTLTCTNLIQQINIMESSITEKLSGGSISVSRSFKIAIRHIYLMEQCGYTFHNGELQHSRNLNLQKVMLNYLTLLNTHSRKNTIHCDIPNLFKAIIKSMLEFSNQTRNQFNVSVPLLPYNNVYIVDDQSPVDIELKSILKEQYIIDCQAIYHQCLVHFNKVPPHNLFEYIKYFVSNIHTLTFIQPQYISNTLLINTANFTPNTITKPEYRLLHSMYALSGATIAQEMLKLIHYPSIKDTSNSTEVLNALMQFDSPYVIYPVMHMNTKSLTVDYPI